MDQGSILFIDELNARLHPLLVRNIILTFLSPEINTRNAQLIFTTHDIWQFSNELLRRDEALAKNYLTGNYGATEIRVYWVIELKDIFLRASVTFNCMFDFWCSAKAFSHKTPHSVYH